MAVNGGKIFRIWTPRKLQI